MSVCASVLDEILADYLVRLGTDLSLLLIDPLSFSLIGLDEV